MRCAEPNVPKFVVKDSLKKFRAVFIALGVDPGEGGRGNVETACLEHHRHNRQPGGDVMARSLGRLPQAAMRRKLTVPTTQTAQLAREQREMHCFVRRNRQKIADEPLTHLADESTGN